MEISPLTGICASSLGVVLLVLAYAFIRGSRGLRAYIVMRALLTIPMVLILVSVIFFVMRVIPGDPVTSQLGPRGGQEARERMTTPPATALTQASERPQSRRSEGGGARSTRARGPPAPQGL